MPDDSLLSSQSQPIRTVGSYQLLQEIGSGGMSRVYRARHTGQTQDLAVKVIHIDNVDNDFERRMRREPDIQSGIAHQNIVQLIDYFRVENEFFLVMEYVNGRSLAHIIYAESGPLPFEHARHYFRQLLRAVDQLHRLGIIHRDIKPSNVMVDQNDVVKLADFGIAKFAWQQGQTQTQNGLGTPEYMSPEQARGAMIDHRTDIFSLGVTLFETLTAHKPFWRDDKTPMGYVSVIQDVINKPLPDPRTYNPAVPAGVVPLLNQATAKNPLERFQSCSQFLGALELIDERDQSSAAMPHSAPTIAYPAQDADYQGTGAPAPPQRTRERPPIPLADRQAKPPQSLQPPPRRRRLAGLWIALLLVAVGVGGFFLVNYLKDRFKAQTTQSSLSNADAMKVAQRVAQDIKDYGENNPQGYASLFAEKDVEYLTAKNLTRKDVEWKRKVFLKSIASTDKLDITVKDARALDDSTIQTELVMDYDRKGRDGAQFFGSTSNIVILRNINGQWLITNYRRKWDNSQRIDPPKKDTTRIDTAAAPVTPQPHSTPVNPTPPTPQPSAPADTFTPHPHSPVVRNLSDTTVKRGR